MSMPSESTDRWILPIFCGCLLAILAFIGYLAAPDWFSLAYWAATADGGAIAATPRATILRDLGGIILGGIGLALLTWRSIVNHRQLKVTLDGQLEERFQSAAELMGKEENQSLREAGIHALIEVVKRDPKTYYDRGIKLLCSFVRYQSPVTDHIREQFNKGPRISRPKEDVVEAITALCFAINNYHIQYGERTEVNLRMSYIFGLNFSNININEFHITQCIIDTCYFENVNFREFHNDACIHTLCYFINTQHVGEDVDVNMFHHCHFMFDDAFRPGAKDYLDCTFTCHQVEIPIDQSTNFNRCYFDSQVIRTIGNPEFTSIEMTWCRLRDDYDQNTTWPEGCSITHDTHRLTTGFFISTNNTV
ncbi:hypothetical protein [Polycladidibacter hongkongensis]|uniref:hypothetical protein n=1 Tax=Polycladidibacter hongkongensis TaxID=1647556 RepID=UPI00082A1C06|nr:hypothetical protein [Pseudovibrio hongkongensis]